MNESSTDLLVVGGGMAGLSAGAWAAQRGARVTLVEKAPQIGGTAALAGFVWTAASYEALREAIPDGDPELARRLVEGIGPALDWIASLGVTLGPEVSILRYGRGRQLDMASYLRTGEAMIRKAPGGRVLLGAAPERLLTSGGGRVSGAEVALPEGGVERIAADAVLLATGGFQNDPVLTSLLIHPNSYSILRRSNPVSAGGGLRLALAVGAAFGKDRAGFYGHLVSYPTTAWEPSLFVALTLYHSEHGVLLNRAGRRFIDETLSDHLSAQAVLEQPEGRALLVTDERVRREYILGSYVEGIEPVDKVALVRRYGGHPAARPRPRPRTRQCTPLRTALLRGRGAACHNVHSRGAADRRRRPGTGHARLASSGPLRGGRRQRRGVRRRRLRRRPGDGPGLRSPGRP
jgi:hypothetical protein